MGDICIIHDPKTLASFFAALIWPTKINNAETGVSNRQRMHLVVGDIYKGNNFFLASHVLLLITNIREKGKLKPAKFYAIW